MSKNKNGILARGLGSVDGHIGKGGRYGVSAVVGGGAGAAVSHFTSVSPVGMAGTVGIGVGVGVGVNLLGDLVVDKEEYLEEKAKVELSSALKTIKKSKEVDSQSASAIDDMLKAM